MLLVEEAANRLEQHLEANVEIISCESRVWNNGALGCPEPGKFYTQALVPGYEILLSCGDQFFSVHTDSNGRHFVLASDPPIPLVKK